MNITITEIIKGIFTAIKEWRKARREKQSVEQTGYNKEIEKNIQEQINEELKK